MAVAATALRASPRFPTRATRLAAGRAMRRRVPRSSHGVWAPPRDRPDPIRLLESFDGGRVRKLLPIRYGRMSTSPFAFLRGSASLMAADLATTPVTGIRVQLCGDAHLANFGVFGTPERDAVFDLNDFDETLPGPWEWDIKRLAVSLIAAGRQNRFPQDTCRRATLTAVRCYRESLNGYGGMRYLDIWYSHLDLTSLTRQVKRHGRHLIDRAVDRARRQTSLHVFPRLVRRTRGGYRIRDDLPLIAHYRNSADEESSRRFFEQYLRSLPDERRRLLDEYHLVDVAQKVVGVGSVGTVTSVLLLMGDSDVEDPWFLQLKEADSSALEPFAGASRYPNHAERVVHGQHLIQEASDSFLGWSTLGSRDFYVRQLRDMKFASDITTLGPKAFVGQAELCGSALARAHARSGDPALISGYLGEGDQFDRAIVRFAEVYADQTERDFRSLLKAIRRGRLAARVDV